MNMMNKLVSSVSSKFKSNLFKNSLWGVLSNVFQNILFSVFFIVIAREYSTDDFAHYIIANTLYAFVVGFASLGLGQWFIRELINTENKDELIDKFFKIQLYIGFIFYAVNVGLAFTLYESQLIRSLSLLIGINVIFDNFIYVIKFINIARYEQRKTFVILTVEAVLKFLIACILLIHPISIVYLALLLILLRVITLNLFIKFGSSNTINLRHILSVKVSFSEVKKIIGDNWAFVIIGSISVIYWTIGNLLVSKILALRDVANYEVSYKLFSMAEILPVIVSTSIYPLLINAFKDGVHQMHGVYKKAFLVYGLYGLLAFTFIYSYADLVIPFLFGEKYIETPRYCKEMFLTILIFPTALLQANVLVTMKLEKLDMWCNIVSLAVSLLLCGIGFYYFKTLSVVNYAIFFSFLAFHIIQDVVLIKRKITTIAHVLTFYLCSSCIVAGYYLLAEQFNKEWLFFIFWGMAGVAALGIFFILKRNNKALTVFPTNKFRG
jgi:O-antigen/teichoic acid export membrane protein